MLDILWSWPAFTAWFVGWTGSIWPIAKAIMLSDERAKVRKKKKYGEPATGAVPVPTAILASILGLAWPLALPFLASHFLHTRRKFDSRDVLTDVQIQVRNEELRDAGHRAAMKEVEAAANELTQIEAKTVGGRQTEEHGWYAQVAMARKTECTYCLLGGHDSWCPHSKER